MIESLVFSICDLGYNEINILIDGVKLDHYPKSHDKFPKVLNKNIGINKTYNLSSRDNINKVVVYYLDNISDNYFYVPVTKYVNDDRDKIKIIVEELTSSSIYEDNLMSFLNSKVKLNSYHIDDDVMYLDFNEYLFDSNDKVLEEVIYTIAYSVFDNYPVNMVMFEVNNKNVKYVNINEMV